MHNAQCTMSITMRLKKTRKRYGHCGRHEFGSSFSGGFPSSLTFTHTTENYAANRRHPSRRSTNRLPASPCSSRRPSPSLPRGITFTAIFIFNLIARSFKKHDTDSLWFGLHLTYLRYRLIIAFTAERFLAIRWPMLHHRISQGKRSLQISVAIFCLSSLVAVVRLIDYYRYYTIFLQPVPRPARPPPRPLWLLRWYSTYLWIQVRPHVQRVHG